MSGPGEIDVVVRFHDVNRLRELERCVFSLVGQTYRPLRIILAVQRFSDTDIARTRAALAPLLDGEADVVLDVVNWEKPEPVDARSVLLNIGVAAARGRYLAYLDYDDVLYPDAYEILIERLTRTGAVIAFASVRVMQLDVYDSFFYAARKLVPPFRGHSLMDLFRNNFCPLHSYLIDRSAIAPELLTFNAGLLMEEDYDVLLKICARYPSDFALIGTDIGDYYYKTDGSNTVPVNGVLSEASKARYANVRSTIEHRKRVTFLTDAVRRSLGVPPTAHALTVHDVVDQYG